jgi:Mg-chelatase subunit ChlD
MTIVAKGSRMDGRGVGLVLLLFTGAICCGGAVEAARTEDTNAGGTGNTNTGGGAGVAGGTTTTQPTHYVLTPEQRDAIESSCHESVVTAPIELPLAVSFLVDTSASMLEASAASSGTLRWTLAHDATFLAIDALRSSDAAGLVLFPNQDTSPNLTSNPFGAEACINVAALQAVAEVGAVPMDPRSTMRSAVNGVALKGATALFDAYRLAVDSLRQSNKQSYVVLITDGRATMAAGCQGDGTEATLVNTEVVIDAIAEANGAEGIGTIVAGTIRNEPAVVPSNEVRDWLSNAATAGGAAIPSSCSPSGNPKYCHVDLTQGTSGVADLLKAVGQRPSCTVPLDAVPNTMLGLDSLYLLFDTPLGNSILYAKTDASCPNGEGYHLDPAANSATLCSASCETVQREPYGTLVFFWACQVY